MKKRYQTSQQIQKKIREERGRASLITAEAEEHNRKFKEMIKVPQPWTTDYRDAVGWEKENREKKFRQAERIEKTVIPKLIAKIQEFNTNLLPCYGDDRSVPV